VPRPCVWCRGLVFGAADLCLVQEKASGSGGAMHEQLH